MTCKFDFLPRVRTWLVGTFEVSRSGAQNIRPMEGLRGFAAFIVFLTHYCGFVRPYMDAVALPGFIHVMDIIGNSGVDLFFVLSGYLIYGSLISRAQPFGRYISKRTSRIYPVFLVVFLIYIPLSFLFPGENKIPGVLSDALVYLGANLMLLVPILVPFDPLVNVTWSLSYEMFYYALVPLLIVSLRLRERSPSWRIVFFSVLAGVYLAYCLISGAGKPRLVMFIAGILLFEVIKNTRLRAPGSFITLLSLIFGLSGYAILSGGENAGPFRALILFMTYFTLCFCCFHNPTARLRQVFEWTPLRWFGNMSYSFYMIHALAMQGFFIVLGIFLPAHAGHGLLFFWAMMPMLFLAALLPALVLFLLVERPFSLTQAAPTAVPQRAPGKLPNLERR